jgi:hypothetical protein
LWVEAAVELLSGIRGKIEVVGSLKGGLERMKEKWRDCGMRRLGGMDIR